ncbi:DUF6519 domain-containing protein [Halomonas heilongjiangensis]|uniref:Uncharacterized protein n=1 Tax=Halomonas heilongjiangensis TaxID=1387883 RepID=A0A2N7TFB0_9GAMM|nr:DUF6519 domain-containing protein [Halomonas heilongjiangensis]PMR66868.1 hypothetical protein C1H66_22185 [Halomonas heilongjiangensis]PXX91246.1 hypothetical protein CR158_06910 [Halomonas heilongjiangensis]
MSFDLSRIRFDARKDFLGVVMQQGRVQLDADWNEWIAQLARRLQAGTLDTFGGAPGSGIVPRITPDGFRIEASGGGLTIGAGRVYVDGLLAENHGGAPEAWEPRLAESTGTTPLDYGAQPYYPEPPALPDGGPHLVYLDVWQRDVTPLQEPDLIEKAVGIDTTGRRQTVWQVKVLPEVGSVTCATPVEEIPGWQEATAPSAARLTTAIGDPGFDPDPCQVPPAAGYRGLENQLYRVEVHTGGALGMATFKWSRDNATVASRVTHINPARDRVTVESIGRDDLLRFHDGDWVEVTDDWRELHGLPGELRRIRVAGGVDETARTLEFESPLSAGLFPTDAQQATDALRNTRVRRWDQSGQVRREDGTSVQDLDAAASAGDIVIPAAGTRLFLEHGILVDFDLAPAGGDFKSGDHWVFAARSVDATIELLDDAPPLGIHHHHARLAVVTFPDTETDCRVLWPPIVEGEGCDCSICVSAEGHNGGTATLQQAIDSIKDIGGTVCLGIGSYAIAAPLNIDGARSLRLRGQGWGTLLVGSQPGGLVEITDSTGVALENLTLIGSSSGSGVTSVIAARNVVDLRLEHLNVLGLAVGDSTSVGIGLSGNLLGMSIADCALVAERGIANVAGGDRSHVLTGELRIARNLFFCSQRGVSLDGTSLHYGNTRIEGNLMLVGNQAAIVATGAVLPGSPMTIADNVIYTSGHGIRAGVDGLTIERNEIAGAGNRSGDGIVLEEGLDPVALDHVRITGNRLLALQGNGIVISHRVELAIIAGNLIDGMGLGALVMGDGATSGHLSFTGNRCLNLGQALNDADTAFAGVQLIRVQHGDVLDNVIANVARQAIASPGIDALRAGAVGQLRMAGNCFYGIGPDRISAPVSAARLLPPFDRVAVDDNSIERLEDDDQQPNVIEWHAINIAPEPLGAVTHFAAASYFVAADAAYLLTATAAIALPLRRSNVSIRGNQLRGHLTAVPLNQCASVDHCLFADNHCEVVGEGGGEREPLLGRLAARTLDASHNRLIAPGDLDTLHLHPQVEQAIVMGNTSTGNIRVQGGAPVPAEIGLSNILGV